MKKQLLTLLLVVMSLLSSATAWGQKSEFDITSDPTTLYYVTLQAQASTPTAGMVQLKYTDIEGVIENPWITLSSKPANPYTSEDFRNSGWQDGFTYGAEDAKQGKTKEYKEWFYEYDKAGYDAGYEWVDSGQLLNETNPTSEASQVALNGCTQMRMEGVDNILGMSSYAYFYATAKENDGWYFAGWSYTNGAYDLGGNVNEEQLFKILPGTKTGFDNITTQNVYATFLPIQVVDYTVSGLMNVGIAANATAAATIVFNVKGERVSKEDFTASVSEANFSANITSCVNNQVTITVTYTNPSSDVQQGEFRGNVVLASKSGCSQLTAPVYARVSEAASTEATLYDGKTAKQSGTIADLIAAIGTLENPIISLNKNYTSTLATTSTFTLDLNGYDLNGLTVNGGELTVAYSKYGGNINSTVAVNAGKLILNGATLAYGVTVASGATLEQNGATINATNIAIENNGTTIINEGVIEGTSTAGVKSTGALTINGGVIKGNYALWVAGGTADVKKGTLTGTAYGIYSDASTTTEKLATIYGGTNAIYVANGTTTLNNGKFDGATPLAKQSEGTLNINAGYFKTQTIGVALPIGKKLLNVSAGVEYNAGYRYFVGDDESAQLSGVGVCKIGTTAYATLEDALAYANNNPTKEVVIIMLNDYVLPAGYYTLPKNATLIVPMADNQETAYPTVNRVSDNSETPVAYVQPYEFRRLTFASGVNIEVFGTIELTGTQRASDDAYASMPHGAYGLLVMNDGAKMVLQNGSELRAWGYMIGKGETDARRGAIVREQFQMGDWKGGSASFAMLSDGKGVFPITQYFIQNIESPVKYHPGAVLSTTASVSAVYGSLGLTAMANDVKIIGVAGKDDAMFLMDNKADAENTWVRKWYNAETDQQTYEVNSGAKIGSMVLDLGKLGTEPLVMNSGMFVLPITNNMKIHLLSGYMNFTQNTALLPGAEVEIDKESVVSITKNSNPSIKSGALYIYDAVQWGAYAYPNKYTKRVMYSATLNAQPTVRDENACTDASINVHGTFDTQDGYVYTSEGGANIFSTNEDAGTFIFSISAQAGDYTETIYQMKADRQNYDAHIFGSAKLKNGDGTSYTNTASTPASTSYCYMNNAWNNLYYLDGYVADLDMLLYMSEVQNKQGGGDYDLGKAIKHLYIKPSEWVEIKGKVTLDFIDNPSAPYIESVEGNEDHTYSDKAGEGRLFILTYGANDAYQWWEVEKKDNLYYSAKNDTYYYWDDIFGEWVEKQYTITWQNWNGEKIISYDYSLGTPTEIEYSVPYGTMAEYLGTNPTREADIDYTYDFAGWTPELGKVTSDVTYTATYTKKERKYTIIFQTEGGVEIERQFLTHNQVPVCENMPTKVGHYLEWQPAIAAVTGDAVYTATWLEEKPTAYTITFVDYDGTTVLQSGEVAANTMPVYTGAIPNAKPATSEYTYAFDHWSPELAEATENMTYTAVYKEVEKTYTISYYKEDGTTLISTEQLPYGATPTPPMVTKENPQTGYVYTLVWKALDGTSTIQTVTGDASYKPTYIEEVNIMPVAEIIRTGLAVGQLGTVCLPYNIPSGQVYGATFYTLAGKKDNKVVFDEVTGELAAGVPYLFQATATEVTCFPGTTIVSDPINAGAMKGTFVDLTLTELLNIYYFAGRALWSCVDLTSLSVPANRAYVNMAEVTTITGAAPVGVRRITLGVNGQNTATGVDQVQGNEVQSTKVLINGQMFIYRNGKMYDAQGKLVK